MDYEISKSATTITGKVSDNTKQAYAESIKTASAKNLNALASGVCKDLGLTAVKVKIGANRPEIVRANKPNKVKWAETVNNEVIAYKFYPSQDRKVKASEMVKGVLYELLKAYDTQVLEMTKSMRTSGYYSRFNDLTKKLG